VLCLEQRPLVLKVTGLITSTHVGSKNFELEPPPASSFTIKGFDNEWRERAREIGAQLYKDVFVQADKLRDAYLVAIAHAGFDSGSIRLRFVTEHNALAVPYEYLYDRDAQRVDPFIALRHPISRVLVGWQTARHVLSPSAFNQHASSGAPLRILLIAAAPGETIAIDNEIRRLSEGLPV